VPRLARDGLRWTRPRRRDARREASRARRADLPLHEDAGRTRRATRRLEEPVRSGVRLLPHALTRAQQIGADCAAIVRPLQSRLWFVAWPRKNTAITITAAMKTATMPYSTAVAPRSSAGISRERSHVIVPSAARKSSMRRM